MPTLQLRMRDTVGTLQLQYSELMSAACIHTVYN